MVDTDYRSVGRPLDASPGGGMVQSFRNALMPRLFVWHLKLADVGKF
jgi:hypothetical protein